MGQEAWQAPRNGGGTAVVFLFLRPCCSGHLRRNQRVRQVGHLREEEDGADGQAVAGGVARAERGHYHLDLDWFFGGENENIQGWKMTGFITNASGREARSRQVRSRLLWQSTRLGLRRGKMSGFRSQGNEFPIEEGTSLSPSLALGPVLPPPRTPPPAARSPSALRGNTPRRRRGTRRRRSWMRKKKTLMRKTRRQWWTRKRQSGRTAGRRACQ